jgi:hypothetical protein
MCRNYRKNNSDEHGPAQCHFSEMDLNFVDGGALLV